MQLDYTTLTAGKINDLAILTLGGGTLDLKGGTTNTEIVASTMLTAGTASSVTRSTTGSVLQMNIITPGAGASVNFGASSIATTDNNNVNGILGAWATIGGTDWAKSVDSGAADTPITAYTAYTDVPRQTAGTIANASATNVRIIEGSGTNSITLGAATTTINTLYQSDVGGTGDATIDPNGQTLRPSAILVGTGAGGLTIGTGTLSAATAGGDLRLINNTANALTINSVIADNTSASTLTKTGAGTATLAAANTYAGATTVWGGTLVLSGNNSTSGVTLYAATLSIGNAGALGAGTFTIAGAGTVQAVGTIVTTNAVAANSDFTIGGTGALTLGAVTLNANRIITNNDTTGTTTFGAISGATRTSRSPATATRR